MGSYGPKPLSQHQGGLHVNADGLPEYPQFGYTINWDTVDAPADDVTLPDGQVIPAGVKYLRYGTVLALIGTAEVQTIDLGGATGGTWTASLGGNTTEPLAYNASAQEVQDELRKLVNDAGLTVAITAGDYVVTFPAEAGNTDLIAINGDDLTGGGATSVTATTPGTGDGRYGPAETDATDGRQTLSRGRCMVLNRTVREDELNSDHAGAAFVGGRFYADRVLVGQGNQPTMANLLAALPRLTPVYG